MLKIPDYSEKQIKERLQNLSFSSMDERSLFFLSLCKNGGVRAIDIDGILYDQSTGGKIVERIPDSCHKYTILYTARLEVDRKETEKLLNRIGIKYDALVMNKLPYDILIDDKSFNNLKELSNEQDK